MTEYHPSALERLADCLEEMQHAYPLMKPEEHLEFAVDMAQVVLVDMMDTLDDETDLERALRGFLYYTRPMTGPFGQSMENTMAADADRRLRRAAAHYLKGE